MQIAHSKLLLGREGVLRWVNKVEKLADVCFIEVCDHSGYSAEPHMCVDVSCSFI